MRVFLSCRKMAHQSELLPASGAFRRLGDFSSDGNKAIYASTERNGRDFDLYVVEVSSGETRLVYESELVFSRSVAAWRRSCHRLPKTMTYIF